MRLSWYPIKTIKDISSEDKSKNAQLLVRAWFVNQLMAWVYTYLPMWLKVIRKIGDIIRDEINRRWCREILMPALHPKSIWEQTGRWDTLDVLFRFSSYYTKKDYVFAWTHEEVITPLMKNFILSYKDLPVSIYQIQTKFRDELRAKSWVLRWREFIMKDLYSFHATQTDLDEYYDKILNSYINIYDRVWIWDHTYITYASWWSFSKYSHEFQTITDAWEDIIYLCEKCNIAINKEIINEQDHCPVCKNKNLLEKKAIEVWNIFKLQNKFSDAFDLKFTDTDGSIKPVLMWCYWIWLGRLMWTVVELLSDDKWMVWPESIAPYKYIVIPIGIKWKEKAEELYIYLRSKGNEVVIDDRDESIWFKFKDADLIGYPYQIVSSDKTLERWENIIELTNRATWEKKMIDYKNIIS